MTPKKIATPEDYLRQNKLKKSSERSFGIVFAVVFGLIAFWPLLDGREQRDWAMFVSLAFLAVAILKPALLRPFNILWFRFGLLLHRVVNPLVMGVLFFCVITPMSLVLRAMGKELLHLRFEKARKSYWEERKPRGPRPDTMSNQF